MGVDAATVIVGDELLAGHTRDANLHHLARSLHSVHVPLVGAAVVADDPDAIVAAIRSHLRPDRMIVTSGGIGSTHDDITVAAIAASVERPLVTDPLLQQVVDNFRAWLQGQGVALTEAMDSAIDSMAVVPDGSRTVAVDGAWLPAILTDIDGGLEAGGTTIAIGPGVPSQFAAMVDGVLLPMLAGRNSAATVVEITHDLPEALIADLLVAAHQPPDVVCGSYPGRPATVRLSGDEHAVATAAENFEQQLAARLDEPGMRSIADTRRR